MSANNIYYMPCIYETINIFNRDNNINPYRYIGSDQHDKIWYFGSSKSLKRDIVKYGKDNFIKNTIVFFEEISNVDLRNKEKEMLSEIDCANDSSYYNKTNSSVKGYVLTNDDRIEKSNQLREAQLRWRGSLSEDEYKKIKYNLSVVSKNMDIPNEMHKIEFWVKKYGEIGEEKFNEFKEKISNSKKGEKNGMSKYTDKSKETAIDLFFNKNKTRKEICTITGISYGVLKVIIRNYQKYGIISTK
jgi:hypothetical protein